MFSLTHNSIEPCSNPSLMIKGRSSAFHTFIVSTKETKLEREAIDHNTPKKPELPELLAFSSSFCFLSCHKSSIIV